MISLDAVRYQTSDRKYLLDQSYSNEEQKIFKRICQGRFWSFDHWRAFSENG